MDLRNNANNFAIEDSNRAERFTYQNENDYLDKPCNSYADVGEDGSLRPAQKVCCYDLEYEMAKSKDLALKCLRAVDGCPFSDFEENSQRMLQNVNPGGGFAVRRLDSHRVDDFTKDALIFSRIADRLMDAQRNLAYYSLNNTISRQRARSCPAPVRQITSLTSPQRYPLSEIPVYACPSRSASDVRSNRLTKEQDVAKLPRAQAGSNVHFSNTSMAGAHNKQQGKPIDEKKKEAVKEQSETQATGLEIPFNLPTNNKKAVSDVPSENQSKDTPTPANQAVVLPPADLAAVNSVCESIRMLYPLAQDKHFSKSRGIRKVWQNTSAFKEESSDSDEDLNYPVVKRYCPKQILPEYDYYSSLETDQTDKESVEMNLSGEDLFLRLTYSKFIVNQSINSCGCFDDDAVNGGIHELSTGNPVLQDAVYDITTLPNLTSLSNSFEINCWDGDTRNYRADGLALKMNPSTGSIPKSNQVLDADYDDTTCPCRTSSANASETNFHAGNLFQKHFHTGNLFQQHLPVAMEQPSLQSIPATNQVLDADCDATTSPNLTSSSNAPESSSICEQPKATVLRCLSEKLGSTLDFIFSFVSPHNSSNELTQEGNLKEPDVSQNSCAPSKLQKASLFRLLVQKFNFQS